ncbi:S-methyl-5'-thioadenosine phosphorylase [Pseudolysinimonas kribbensis]|uniref:MTAP family purine nucleoside phosphorylase n=1 Tax=Pseudolysinimonas kribbensis TaxID=433641 RepID=UPI0031D8AC65
MSATASVAIAVIGGSGLYRLFDDPERIDLQTPYGSPSDAVTIGELAGRRVAFLPRHGEGHRLAPHRINARANIWALARLGVRAIVSSSAVGAVDPALRPGDLVLPSQLIDRTWGRADTYFDDDVQHLPAADPFDPELRRLAAAALRAAGESPVDGVTSVVVQGPRFSTRAESRWFRAAGAQIVNMTQYPEAVLAAELGVGLVALSFVTDIDADIDAERDGAATGDGADAELVLRRMAQAAPRIRAAIAAIVAAIPDDYAGRRLLPAAAIDAVLAR